MDKQNKQDFKKCCSGILFCPFMGIAEAPGV